MCNRTNSIYIDIQNKIPKKEGNMKKSKNLKMTMLFLLILYSISMTIVIIKNAKVNYLQKGIEIRIEQKLEKKDTQEKAEDKIIFENGEIGFIIIPILNLKAPIKEGTTGDILKYSVGHFKGTGLWNGNVALASHNGGSYAHYFSRINELKNGEEIIYITNMGERRYKVEKNKIIEETDLQILKNTEENIITLVTCVNGTRNKRQCIIGKEI